MKRQVARIALLAGVLVLAMGAPAGAGDSFAGDWGGHAVDTRGDEFDIKLSLHPDGSAAIVYDGKFEDKTYHCTGLLLPISVGAKMRVFREAITSGTCIDGAEVALSQGKDGLGFSWTGVWEEKGLTAKGALKRAR
jgi:hypothetical protein